MTVDGKLVYVHRFAYELLVGPCPPLLDHLRTCPKRCVRPDHLRPATKGQNVENHNGARRDSRSGVRGVYQHECGKWYGQTKHQGVRYGTGLCDTLAEAEAKVIELRNALHTHNDLDREILQTTA
jgi:hypothetical protein